MDKNQPISIMIHDLNPWGGQDRSMLEIAWQLNKEFPLEIHSFTLEGYDNWPNMKHIKYEANLQKPIILKYLNYHFKSWKNLSDTPHRMVQSTGTASLKSNIVQVQFIHHSWQKIAKTLPADKFKNSGLAKSIYHKLLDKYKLLIEKKVYTPNKKYIAISHTIKKELMEHFQIPEKNISIIHHGVDLKHFTPAHDKPANLETRNSVRESLNISPEDIVLLHVGALNARKGLLKSLEVLSYLKKEGFQNIKYLAVGQGDQKLLQKLIRDHDLEDVVIIAPHSKDIRNYYWASDIFFFPTYYEPFGLVVLEAMACGLPIATGNTAGSAELIIDKQNGVLFSPFSQAQDIAQSLNTLLKNKSYRDQLGKAARETSLEHSWETVGAKYNDFYSNC